MLRSAEAYNNHHEGQGQGLSWLRIAGVLVLVFGILIITRPSREPGRTMDGWTENTEWFNSDQKKKPAPKPPGMVFVVK